MLSGQWISLAISARLFKIFLMGNFYLFAAAAVCEFGSFSPDFRLICTIRRDVDWNDPICLTDLPFPLLLLLLHCCR